MKNRALWVVLFVLAIVSLLMVFVIMPRLNLTDGDAGQLTAESPAQPAQDVPASETASQKMDRLKAEAVTAVERLNSLFAEGRTPGMEAYSAARTLAIGAVTALASLDIPADLDKNLSEAMSKVRADAAKALALIQQLPADPARAAVAIAGVKSALLGEPVETAATIEQPIAPRFDVLRVEPDGSTVIAGNAPAGATVEIVSGDKVLSSQTVDGSGDFAAVLDNPLPPGDHALTIRSTETDGKETTSQEVATISVPADTKGELLAMVSKPGEASRMITLPGQGDVKSETSADEPVAGNTGSQNGFPDLPAGAGSLASQPPTMNEAQTRDTAALTTDTAGQKTSETQPAAEILVSAVEIEGNKIFVAGQSQPDRTVRGFADKARIGETISDTKGNFVIEGNADLSVGNHLIEVELLDDKGNVVVRAAVPFNRPAGEQVSVVAQTASPDANTTATQDEIAYERLRIALTKSLTILQNLYTGDQAPAVDQVAAARSSVEIGLQSILEFRPPADAPDQLVLKVATQSTKAKEALALLQGIPRGDVDAMGSALPRLLALLSDLTQLAPPQMAEAKPEAQAVQSAASEPRTIQQAPLSQSNESVIIRRGDTLWQISRRVYGQGVRYTTIYLANANAIRNPDMIAPGQIFTVPQDALPNAEEIHRKRLRGEAVN
ncbi:Ig-like domain-containing protein [Peteryoungia ipomoeae]|uniref:LysM peptidoglycan-binding domain-containing protein n=1 Tax=Peteryoungia ipomoeae TaxID=1210932 RepID=A0A4S8P854_9HYPH|nr:Ig-like domain-containing protein [Peteryoungia ipomoeae]THV25715.1 LysM peptidoglycan-binding domain-containing protein [Peteryoungia ipomoeae]